MFCHELSLEPLNLLLEKRCFVPGFRQFSAHLTKCHACHGICTLSPLDAALTMRFANKMQPANPNAHTYVHGTDVETHGYAVTQNTFPQWVI